MLAPNVAPTGTADTPFTLGKRHRADELGERVMIARSWRMLAYALVLLQALSLGLIGWLAMQPKLVPVYIHADTASGRMQVLESGTPSTPLRQEVIKRELREFIETIRGVSPDKYLMQRRWKDVFRKVTPRGYRALAEYATTTNPLALEGEVRIEILRILAQSPQTYDMRWAETTHTDAGTETARRTYSGLLTWVARDPAHSVTLEELTANPAGIYLDAWSWSQE